MPLQESCKETPEKTAWTSGFAIAAAALYLLVAAATFLAAVTLIDTNLGRLDQLFARVYPLALTISMHIPAAYAIVRTRVWLFLAAPLGWLTSFCVFMATIAIIPIGRHHDISGLGVAFFLIILSAGVVLQLILLLFAAVAFYCQRKRESPRWWNISRREVQAGLVLFAIGLAIDTTIIAFDWHSHPEKWKRKNGPPVLASCPLKDFPGLGDRGFK